MARTIPVLYTSYRHILDAVRKESLRLFLLACTEWKARKQPQTASDRLRLPPTVDHMRTIAMLTKLVERSGVIARHIATLPQLDEERDGRIEQRLDLVFSVFAKYKIDLETYHAWLDADLRRELEADMRADYLDDPADDAACGRGCNPACDKAHGEPDPEPDIVGRRPMVLIGELCCDFGIATHVLPPEWLDPAPADLRLLCARAAAAQIRPGRPAHRPIRVEGRLQPMN